MSSLKGDQAGEDDVGLDTLLTASPTHVGDRRQPLGLLIGAACTLAVVVALSIGAVISVGNGSDAPDTGGPGQAATLPENLAAAALGKHSLGPTTSSTGTSPQPTSPSPQHTPTGHQPPRGELTGTPYHGPVAAVNIANASAECVASPGVDGGGNTVTYRAGNMLDGDPTTAWRCDGDGRGETLQFRLDAGKPIVAVSMIPGYAKTDPYDQVDRYAENRRISKVRWTFGGGRWIEQTLSTDPHSRALQALRIPPVKSNLVTLEILDSVPGLRDTVAISSVVIASSK